MADQSHERPEIRVEAAVGGWPHPWPNVAEIADVLPSDQWTLVGGLMTQLHTVHRGLGVVRPTNDVDIVLHIETAGYGEQVPSRSGSSCTLYEVFGEAVDPIRSPHSSRYVAQDAAVPVGALCSLTPQNR